VNTFLRSQPLQTLQQLLLFRAFDSSSPQTSSQCIVSRPNSDHGISRSRLFIAEHEQSSQDIYSVFFRVAFSSKSHPTDHVPTSSNQPLPLPLIHQSLALIFTLPFCSVCRVEQIVDIASHTAPASWWRRVNPLEREPCAGQLPPTFVVVGVVAAAIACVVAGSTACGRFV